MQTPTDFNTRKRRRSDQRPFEPEYSTCQAVSKRPKVANTADPRQPAAFWDGLSEIPLTTRALEEQNRRYKRAARVSLMSPRARRPTTRRAVDKQRDCSPCESTATVLLARGGRAFYNKVKKVSRHGGLDLQKIRGVSISNRSLLLRTNTRSSGCPSILLTSQWT